MRGETLKGHLDLLLLGVLADGPKHGYAVVDELRSRSGGVLDLPEGTVYPALHRLEDQRLLSSSWAVVDSRKRRTYRLTSRGRRALEHQWTSWNQFVGVVQHVVGLEPWPAS